MKKGKSVTARGPFIDFGYSSLKVLWKDRGLEIYIQYANENSKTLIQIVRPAFLRKMKFLRQRTADGREDRWLKTSQGVRRLSEANNAEPLFDSDFTVEDLSAFVAGDFTLSFWKDETVSRDL